MTVGCHRMTVACMKVNIKKDAGINPDIRMTR